MKLLLWNQYKYREMGDVWLVACLWTTEEVGRCVTLVVGELGTPPTRPNALGDWSLSRWHVAWAVVRTLVDYVLHRGGSGVFGK